MKIKTRFRITLLLFGMILAAAVALIIITDHQANRTRKQEELAALLAQEAVELGYLSIDYLHTHSEQQLANWQVSFASLANQLSDLQADRPEARLLVSRINDHAKQLKETFSSVLSATWGVPPALSDDYEAQLHQAASRRLAVQTQGLFADAQQLWRLTHAQASRLSGTRTLLIYLLLGLFGLFLLANYVQTYRRTMRSMAALQTGARMIGAGDLDFQIVKERDDELGEVVSAFNQMAEARRQAEAMLQAERARFFKVLETLPVMIRLMTPDYQVVFANRAFRDKFGEVDGRRCYESCFGASEPCAFCETCRVLETGQPHHWELSTPGGSLIAAYDFPFTDADGSPLILEMDLDITAQRRAEEEIAKHRQHLEELVRERTAALRENQARLETVFAAIPNVMVEYDAEGRAVRANQAALAAIGISSLPFTRDQAVGRLTFRNLDGSPVSIENLPTSLAFRGEMAANHQYLVTIAGGSDRVVAAYAVPLFKEGGKVSGAVAFWHDITELKRAEDALREARDELELQVQKRTAQLTGTVKKLEGEVVRRVALMKTLQQSEEILKAERQRFFDVLEALPVYVVLLDHDYRVAFANKFFRDRFGHSSGRRCYEYLFGRTAPCELCETYKVMRSNAPHYWEWLGPDGRNYDIYDYPFIEKDGSMLILEMGLDITEQKRAHEALRSASQYSRSLIEASLDPLVTISTAGKITDVNEATIRATGISRPALIGTDFASYFTEPEKAEAGYRQVFDRGAVTDYPLTIRHQDGSRTDVLYNATVYKDDGGRVLGAFAAARDITARKKAEEEVRQLNAELEQRVARRTAELEEANREIMAFSYSVSHDLRAPLRAIAGFSRMLLEDYRDRLDATGQDYLQRVSSAAGKMGELIDAMLSLSRLTRHEIAPSRVNLSAMAEEIAAELKRMEPAREVEFVIAQGVEALADSRMIRVMLDNLLRNAWKFTARHAHARIEFGVRTAAGETVYFLRDDGAGFDMQYGGKLFNAFQRLHGVHEFPGIGIGLATVQRIIHRHGGRIWAEGEVEKGATFSFTLSHPDG